MGDRYITIADCPVCRKKYECYDAPSSVMYVGMCPCGYEEPDYYIEKRRKLSKLERDLTGETYTYDLEMKKHTKNYMRNWYKKQGKTKGWIEKALEVDFSTKVRMITTIKVRNKLEDYALSCGKTEIEFDKMLKIVLECEVKINP